MAGEGEEDVVEVSRLHRDALDAEGVLVEPVEQGHQRLRGAVGRDLQNERVVVA